ncbi:stage II sporulation protein M [Hymenobacter rubripertinctus]|uniref:Stage II sporulation protein M n=1 Tax=Hymenobacter rubripertinctus TaxID=2029981 RepID=A0A418R403_9BACT|nr:stage II sporulation protein M [Hymenobacter rubripertinctus]RIY12173.1 stage II sporulation protein M [Hymenobacter rubripertinctus]
MRETIFLRLHEARWQQYEQQPVAGPEELARRYVELTDDLSYARTFYPDSATTAYLNGLTGKLHQALYKNKRQEPGRFLDFWLRELPLLVARRRRQLLATLAFFLVCVFIGALSAAYDDTFVRVVLGDEYVNRTLANIQKGDPMAVYKGEEEAPMFLYITLNNVKVSLYAFAGGITGGLFTLFMLFRNGVMLGSFQWFFYQQGVLLPSVLTIWIHGTLEISAIVLAGGAGWIMAHSLLFPGTYSRRDSLRHGARDGMKLVVGLVPVFVVAGFLEGFVTRHTEMPLPASLSIIGLSATFILGYFVAYPWWLSRKAGS